MKYILTERHGYRIAVILNEYGEEQGIESAFIQDTQVRAGEGRNLGGREGERGPQRGWGGEGAFIQDTQVRMKGGGIRGLGGCPRGEIGFKGGGTGGGGPWGGKQGEGGPRKRGGGFRGEGHQGKGG